MMAFSDVRHIESISEDNVIISGKEVLFLSLEHLLHFIATGKNSTL